MGDKKQSCNFCYRTDAGGRGAPVWLGGAWPVGLLIPLSTQVFCITGPFFSCSLLACLFQWRLLPFRAWPGSPFQVCWQELGIELEPDFHKLIWSQFPVCSQHCSKPAAQSHTPPEHVLGFCVSMRVLPCALPGSSSANWNSLLKFLLCYQPFKLLF